MTLGLQTISSKLGGKVQTYGFESNLEAALGALRRAAEHEVKEENWVRTPALRLDHETFRLLHSHTSEWARRSYLFSAVKQIAPVIDEASIIQLSKVVRSRRSTDGMHFFRTRIDQESVDWAEELARRTRLKLPAVLESVLYLYTRLTFRALRV